MTHHIQGSFWCLFTMPGLLICHGSFLSYFWHGFFLLKYWHGSILIMTFFYSNLKINWIHFANGCEFGCNLKMNRSHFADGCEFGCNLKMNMNTFCEWMRIWSQSTNEIDLFTYCNQICIHLQCVFYSNYIIIWLLVHPCFHFLKFLLTVYPCILFTINS